MASISRGGTGRSTGGGRALAALLLVLTTLEFLLGMGVNLYTTCLPTDTRSVFLSNPCPASSQWTLQAHVVLGAVLILLAIAFLLWGVRSREPAVIGSAFGGLLGLVIGALGGYEYLANGNADYSLLMALGFLMAFGAYFQAGARLRMLTRNAPGPQGWTPPGDSGPSSSPVHEV